MVARRCWALVSRMRADQAAVLLGHGVAGGVGNVDDGGSGIDRGFDHFEQVRRIGAAGVFGVELDVVGVLARQFDGVDGHLQDLDSLLGERLAVAFILEFADDVDVGCADAGVNARPLGFGQRFAAGVDVVGDGAREGADGGTLDFLRR